MERLSEPTEAREGFSGFVTSLDCVLYCRHCFQEKKSLFNTMAGKRLAKTAIPFSHLSLWLAVGARRNWSPKIRLLWSDRITHLICIWTLNFVQPGGYQMFVLLIWTWMGWRINGKPSSGRTPTQSQLRSRMFLGKFDGNAKGSNLPIALASCTARILRRWKCSNCGHWWRMMNRSDPGCCLMPCLLIFSVTIGIASGWPCSWVMSWRTQLAPQNLIHRPAIQLFHAEEPQVHDHGYESLSILTAAYSSGCPRRSEAGPTDPPKWGW